MLDLFKLLPNQDILFKINELCSNDKGYSRDYIRFIVNCRMKLFADLFDKSKTREEYIDEIKKLLRDEKVYYIEKSLINYETYNVLFSDSDVVKSSIALRYLENNIREKDIDIIYERYKGVLFDYISNNNFVKNNFNNYSGPIEHVVADYTIPFTIEDLDRYYKNLFVSVSGDSKEANNIRHNQNVLADLLFRIMVVYDKETLLKESDLVSFELSRGYFEQYYLDIENGVEIPDIASRRAIFDKEKDFPPNILFVLKDIELLRMRINGLNDEKKNYYLEQLSFIPFLNDSNSVVSVINNCLEYYEYTYRKEIIDNLGYISDEVEITDFKDLKPLMVHIIIRDPLQRFLPEIENKNGIKKRSKEYLIDVLLNPFVTEKSVKMKTIHTSKYKRNRWYQSDTSDQLSVSIFAPFYLLGLDSCIGVGFDSGSLSVDNIALSSNTYITTNKGLDNIEILPSKRFNVLSSPWSELSKYPKTELILFRDKNGCQLRAVYVFVALDGKNIKKDKELLERAQKYAFGNRLPLRIFRLDLLKKSYEEQLRNGKVK